MNFFHICILLQKCSSDTREDKCNYTTDWCNFSTDMGFCSFFLQSLTPFNQMVWIFPFRLWLPSNLVRERMLVLVLDDCWRCHLRGSLLLPEAGTA